MQGITKNGHNKNLTAPYGRQDDTKARNTLSLDEASNDYKNTEVHLESLWAPPSLLVFKELGIYPKDFNL